MRDVTVTHVELAEVLGVTSRNVGQLRKRGLPTTDDGERHPLVDAVRWYIKWTEGKAGNSDLEEQEQRERIRKLQIQNAAASHQSVDRDLALRHVERGICEARGILELVPRRVAARVPQDVRPEVEASVQDDISATLRSLEDCKGFAVEDVIEVEPEAAQPEPDQIEETQE